MRIRGDGRSGIPGDMGSRRDVIYVFSMKRALGNQQYIAGNLVNIFIVE